MLGSAGEVEPRLELLEQFDQSDIVQIVGQKKANLTDDREKLHALFAQSRFGNPDDLAFEEMISLIEKAQSGECPNIVAALSPVMESSRKPELISKLKTAYQESTSDTERFRMAVVALHLGELSLAEDLLSHRPDPEFRAQFIERFS